jgi:glycolate oxidase FAD binding subunit
MPQGEALKRLNAWGGQPLPLNASCWQEADGGTLTLRLRGAVAAVEAACRTLGGERLDPVRAAAEWDACRDQRTPWFADADGRDLWRVSVPQTAPVLELPEPPLVEWHGAQRWVRAEAADGHHVRQQALAAGGHATLFRTARADAHDRMTHLAPPLAAIHEQLKLQFDPARILNRGRLYPHL